MSRRTGGVRDLLLFGAHEGITDGPASRRRPVNLPGRTRTALYVLGRWFGTHLYDGWKDHPGNPASHDRSTPR